MRGEPGGSASDLLAQLKLPDVPDRVRSITEALYEELINAEAASVIGASKYELTDERTTVRNGTRPRTLTTAAGDLELRIPKLRRTDGRDAANCPVSYGVPRHGPVVWIRRKCIWWVPDFDATRSHGNLRELGALLRSVHAFVTHSTRDPIAALLAAMVSGAGCTS